MCNPTMFNADGRPYGNATLGFAPDEWHLYFYGFRRASEVLFEHIETRQTSLDSLVYPIVFLCRHQIELAIKLIIRNARLRLDETPPSKPEHRLDVLWRDARSLLERTAGVRQEGLDRVDQVVNQFTTVDPRSTVFRYPETLDGLRNLEELSNNINLFKLRDSVEAAVAVLDAIHTGLSVQLDEAG